MDGLAQCMLAQGGHASREQGTPLQLEQPTWELSERRGEWVRARALVSARSMLYYVTLESLSTSLNLFFI